MILGDSCFHFFRYTCSSGGLKELVHAHAIALFDLFMLVAMKWKWYDALL